MLTAWWMSYSYVYTVYCGYFCRVQVCPFHPHRPLVSPPNPPPPVRTVGPEAFHSVDTNSLRQELSWVSPCALIQAYSPQSSWSHLSTWQSNADVCSRPIKLLPVSWKTNLNTFMTPPPLHQSTHQSIFQMKVIIFNAGNDNKSLICSVAFSCLLYCHCWGRR